MRGYFVHIIVVNDVIIIRGGRQKSGGLRMTEVGLSDSPLLLPQKIWGVLFNSDKVFSGVRVR